MTFQLRVGPRTLVVDLAPDGDGLRGRVAGEPHRLGSVRAGPREMQASGAVVQEIALDVDGRPCRALVARQGGRLLVGFGGNVHAFETGEDTGAAGTPGAGSGAVVAPMPGKIIDVLVAEGDEVTAGQTVVLLEAMKMETTLSAEIAGRVRGVRVVPGQLVEGGEVLVEITPSSA